jgi:hypothetical protein
VKKNLENFINTRPEFEEKNAGDVCGSGRFQR